MLLRWISSAPDNEAAGGLAARHSAKNACSARRAFPQLTPWRTAACDVGID
jgi:hypothetical protein